MPWKECSQMTSRLEFVMLASAPEANVSALCQTFGISRKTGYKWLALFKEQGKDGLRDRSRRPHNSPNRSSAELEKRILDEHGSHPYWGGRKLHCFLMDQPSLTRTPSPQYLSATANKCCLQVQLDRRRQRVSSTKRRTSSGRWTSRVISG